MSRRTFGTTAGLAFLATAAVVVAPPSLAGAAPVASKGLKRSLGGLHLAADSRRLAAGPVITSGDTPDGWHAGNGAVASVDLAGTWKFTPQGRPETTITVPGGGWYKQGFTDVNQATYSRSITVPDTGKPQTVRLEFGAANHEVTLAVDGRTVGTLTTSFTPSNWDITAFVTPGGTHVITADVKGRNALRTPQGRYLVPDAADWSEAVPQGLYRSAFLRVYPAVRVSDTFIKTSVANRTLTYDVTVTNDLTVAQTVALAATLASAGGASFAYPTLPSQTVTVPAKTTQTVTVGPLPWTPDETSYWWPNVPYTDGYRAQLHTLQVTSSAAGLDSSVRYRFGFRDTTQNGEYYYVNGVRINFRGDNLQGADYDRIDNNGKGDAFDTLPGFLPPTAGNGGWPLTVDNYQRLNFNVVRIHQEPGSPYMLDVADEMGLMIIDETAIRASTDKQDFIAGRDNMVNHARDLTLRDRNHASIIRWSQSNEPGRSPTDSEQFEQALYAAMNGNDGTRPVSIDLDKSQNVNAYPGMAYANFALFPHYLDGFAQYGEQLVSVTGRPDGEGEFIWPGCSSTRGFEWFATAVVAKRGKDASDLRPYTLLSGWASFVPGVKTTDFITEEGNPPVYGENNLPDPWANGQIRDIQDAFNPVAALDLPYWSASGVSDINGAFPVDGNVPSYGRSKTVERQVTVFNDDLRGTSVEFTWTAHLDRADGPVVASGTRTLTIPLGSRTAVPVTFTAPDNGNRVYLEYTTAKSGRTIFTDTSQYLHLDRIVTTIDDSNPAVVFDSSWSKGSGETGIVPPFQGTNTFTRTAGARATLTFEGTGVILRGVVAISHGILAVSVDGGPEMLVDQFARERSGDVVLWNSPKLAPGTHTVTVRATGQKSTYSQDVWVTVDRFQILQDAAPVLPSATLTVVSSEPATADGWYRQTVLAQLKAPGSQQVQYRVDGGTWRIYTGTAITVSKSGITIIDHRLLVNNVVVAGSTAQATIKVDRVIPTATVTRSPQSGTGTPRNPITVSFAGADATSGVDHVEYQLGAGAWATAGAALVLKDVGNQLVSYRSVDKAGNFSTVKSLTVTIAADPATTVKTTAKAVSVGGPVTVNVRGYLRYDTIKITVAGRDLGSVFTDQNGSATTTLIVPADAPRGATSVVAASADGKFTANSPLTLR